MTEAEAAAIGLLALGHLDDRVIDALATAMSPQARLLAELVMAETEPGWAGGPSPVVLASPLPDQTLEELRCSLLVTRGLLRGDIHDHERALAGDLPTSTPPPRAAAILHRAAVAAGWTTMAERLAPSIGDDGDRQVVLGTLLADPLRGLEAATRWRAQHGDDVEVLLAEVRALIQLGGLKAASRELDVAVEQLIALAGAADQADATIRSLRFARLAALFDSAVDLSVRCGPAERTASIILAGRHGAGELDPRRYANSLGDEKIWLWAIRVGGGSLWWSVVPPPGGPPAEHGSVRSEDWAVPYEDLIALTPIARRSTSGDIETEVEVIRRVRRARVRSERNNTLRELGRSLIPPPVDAHATSRGVDDPLRIAIICPSALGAVPFGLLQTSDGQPLLRGALLVHAPPERIRADSADGRKRAPAAAVPRGASDAVHLALHAVGENVRHPSDVEAIRDWTPAAQRPFLDILAEQTKGFVLIEAHHGSPEAIHHPLTIDRLPGDVERSHGLELGGVRTAAEFSTLPAPEGVVIAACRGAARIAPFSEEWVGISAAFLSQGARWVIAPRWPLIDSSQTAAFISELVANVQRVGPAQGLRSTMLRRAEGERSTGSDLDPWEWLSWFPWSFSGFLDPVDGAD